MKYKINIQTNEPLEHHNGDGSGIICGIGFFEYGSRTISGSGIGSGYGRGCGRGYSW